MRKIVKFLISISFFLFPFFAFADVGYPFMNDVINSNIFYIGNYTSQYNNTIAPAKKIKVTAVDYYASVTAGDSQFVLKNTAHEDCSFGSTSTPSFGVPVLVHALFLNYSGNDCIVEIGDVIYGQVISIYSYNHVSTRGTLVTETNGMPYYKLYYVVLPDDTWQPKIIITSPTNEYISASTTVSVNSLSDLSGSYNLTLFMRDYRADSSMSYTVISTSSVTAIGTYEWNTYFTGGSSHTYEYYFRLDDVFTGISYITEVRVLHLINPSPEWILGSQTIQYYDCSITSGEGLTGCLKNAMLWTFVPSGWQLVELSERFAYAFKQTFPFSLIARFFVHMDATNVETFPSFTYTFGSYAPSDLEGKSYTFDPFSVTNMSKILEIESDTNNKNIWQILDTPVIGTAGAFDIICMLTLLGIIFSDLFGIVTDSTYSNIAYQDEDEQTIRGMRRQKKLYNKVYHQEKLKGSFKRV